MMKLNNKHFLFLICFHINILEKTYLHHIYSILVSVQKEIKSKSHIDYIVVMKLIEYRSLILLFILFYSMLSKRFRTVDFLLILHGGFLLSSSYRKNMVQLMFCLIDATTNVPDKKFFSFLIVHLNRLK